MYAVFEADKDIDNSKVGNKTIIVYKQNPECIGFYILSDSIDILQSGYFESPLEHYKVDWSVDELID